MSLPVECTNSEVLSSAKRRISTLTSLNDSESKRFPLDDVSFSLSKSLGKVVRKRSNCCKRIKKTKNATKRVTFATPKDIIRYSPSFTSLTDTAEDIRKFHQDIWYTSKEYALFLQDRVDSIRVYRSVQGNMAGLEDFYCTIGLEHFLHENGQMLLKQSQQNVISAVLAEQRRQKLLQRQDPEHVGLLTSRLSANARDQAQKRAIAYSIPATKSMDDAQAMRLPTGNEMFSKPTRLFSLSIPSATPLCNKLFPVDVSSLRQMNAKFLESFQAKVNTQPSLKTLCGQDAVFSHMTAEGVNETRSLSQMLHPENVNTSTTVWAAMNEALAITEVYTDTNVNFSSTNVSTNVEIDGVTR